MTEKEQEILDGLILSDGHLRKQSKSACISFTLKHRAFADAIVDALPSLNWSPINSYRYFDKRTSKEYVQNLVRSRAHSYLTKQHTRWYPHGKKIVPKDLQIKPDTLLWWHLGDGCLERRKCRPNYRRICLSTDSFTDSDLKCLIQSLKELLGDCSSIYAECGRIMISRNALCVFANMLHNSSGLVSEYKYKFEFGQYLNLNYLKDSYVDRPLAKINAYRKKHKVREFDLALL